jgi:hypothetical protein
MYDLSGEIVSEFRDKFRREMTLEKVKNVTGGKPE